MHPTLSQTGPSLKLYPIWNTFFNWTSFYCIFFLKPQTALCHLQSPHISSRQDRLYILQVISTVFRSSSLLVAGGLLSFLLEDREREGQERKKER